MGFSPQVSDAELMTLDVLAVVQQYDNESRWVRHCHAHLRHCSRDCCSSRGTTSGCVSSRH